MDKLSRSSKKPNFLNGINASDALKNNIEKSHGKNILPNSDTSMMWGMVENKEKKAFHENNPLNNPVLSTLAEGNDSDEGIEIEQMGETKIPSIHMPNLHDNSVVLPSTKHSLHESKNDDGYKSEHSDEEVIQSLVKPKKSLHEHRSHRDNDDRRTEKRRDEDDRRSEKRKDEDDRSDKDNGTKEKHKEKRRHRHSESSVSSHIKKKKNDSETDSSSKKKSHKSREKDMSEWTPEELRLKKMEIFALLMELKSYGIELSQEYTTDSDYKLMKQEYDLHRTMRDKQNVVGLYEQSFTTLVGIMEWANEAYNPFRFKLKGYSNQVRMDKNTYREIFGDLYEKYKEKNGKLAPEMRFLITFVGGAANYHAIKAMEEQDDLEEQKIKKMVEQEVERRLLLIVQNSPQLAMLMKTQQNTQHTAATQTSMPVRGSSQNSTQSPVVSKPTVQPTIPVRNLQQQQVPVIPNYTPPQPVFNRGYTTIPYFHPTVPTQFQYPITYPPLHQQQQNKPNKSNNDTKSLVVPYDEQKHNSSDRDDRDEDNRYSSSTQRKRRHRKKHHDSEKRQSEKTSPKSNGSRRSRNKINDNEIHIDTEGHI
jgi:hypothetical protein